MQWWTRRKGKRKLKDGKDKNRNTNRKTKEVVIWGVDQLQEPLQLENRYDGP